MDIRIKNREEFTGRFLLRSIRKYGLKSVLVFSTCHAASKRLWAETKRLNEQVYKLDYEFVIMKNGATSADKAHAVNKIKIGKKVVIFNVRIFGLGSDIPTLESVMLCGNRFSKIDIVQSVSRCLRRAPKKNYAKILIPCIIKGDDLDEEGDYQNLRMFMSSMGSADETIIEEILLCRNNRDDNVDYKITIDPILADEEVLEDDSILNVENLVQKFRLKLFERLTQDDLEIRWTKNLEDACEYFEREGYWPSTISKDPNVNRLGRWVQQQRHRKKNTIAGKSGKDIRTLSQERIDILNNIKGWIWDDDIELRWMKNLEDSCEYFERKGQWPSTRSNDPDVKKLAEWIRTQRHYKKNTDVDKSGKGIHKLSQKRIDTLNAIEGWIWESNNDEVWTTNYANSYEYFERKGKWPSATSKDPDVRRLGLWVQKQRYCKKNTVTEKSGKDVRKLPQRRLDILNATKGWIWIDDKVEKWTNHYIDSCEYFERKGKWPSGGSKDPEDKRLGLWVKTQRSNYKKNTDIGESGRGIVKLSQERIDILNATEGWKW